MQTFFRQPFSFQRLLSCFLQLNLTSYECLYRALDGDPSISIGRVNYIDYNKRFAPVNGSYWHKRKSFSHEKEVRAALVDHKHTIDFGVYVPIDLNLLIQKVYVSPYSSAWFLDVVKDIHVKYKINAPVIQSSLIENPFY